MRHGCACFGTAASLVALLLCLGVSASASDASLRQFSRHGLRLRALLQDPSPSHGQQPDQSANASSSISGTAPCTFYDSMGPFDAPESAKRSCIACYHGCLTNACDEYSWNGGPKTRNNAFACAAENWSNSTVAPEQLESGGSCLSSGQCIFSVDMREFEDIAPFAHMLCAQGDMNLVIYTARWDDAEPPRNASQFHAAGTHPTWASNTNTDETSPYVVCVDSTGSLGAYYVSSGLPYWTTSSYGSDDAYYTAVLHQEGALMVFQTWAPGDPLQFAVWSSVSGWLGPTPLPEDQYPPYQPEYPSVPPPPSPPRPAETTPCKWYGYETGTFQVIDPAAADASCSTCQSGCNSSDSCLYYSWNNSAIVHFTSAAACQSPAVLSQAFVGSGDGFCPPGTRIVTYVEAVTNQAVICNAIRAQANALRIAGNAAGYSFVLDTPLRLEGGGMFQGPRSERVCQVQAAYSLWSPLSGTLCVPTPSNAQGKVDCRVSWRWGECSASCGGGQQEVEGTVIQYPANGGTRCPNLRRLAPCNMQPC